MVSMACFSDLMVTQKSKGTTRLEKISGLINWTCFDERLEKIGSYANRVGRWGLIASKLNFPVSKKAMVLKCFIL